MSLYQLFIKVMKKDIPMSKTALYYIFKKVLLQISNIFISITYLFRQKYNVKNTIFLIKIFIEIKVLYLEK